ncbi:hypothetical protein M0804_014238 [Polistes exclamans]|nr:hypothetical protein M0804_014238 [Polistes exclamans]
MRKSYVMVSEDASRSTPRCLEVKSYSSSLPKLKDVLILDIWGMFSRMSSPPILTFIHLNDSLKVVNFGVVIVDTTKVFSGSKFS